MANPFTQRLPSMRTRTIPPTTMTLCTSDHRYLSTSALDSRYGAVMTHLIVAVGVGDVALGAVTGDLRRRWGLNPASVAGG